MSRYDDSPDKAEAEIRAAGAEIDRIENELDNAISVLDDFEPKTRQSLIQSVESEIEVLQGDLKDAWGEMGRVQRDWGFGEEDE